MDERGYRPPSAGSEQSIERIAFAAVYFAQGGTGFSRLGESRTRGTLFEGYVLFRSSPKPFHTRRSYPVLSQG